MKTLEYTFTNDDLDWTEDKKKATDLMVRPCVPSSSEWFISLSYFTGEGKSIGEVYSNLKSRFLESVKSGNNQKSPDLGSGYMQTAKSCPGIKTLFKNSFLVTTPCDSHITVDDDLEISYCHTSSDTLMTIDYHPRNQFVSEKHALFKDKINVKFSLPIALYTKTNAIMLPPTYHTETPWTVLPGVISPATFQINVLAMFDLRKESYFIPKGTPLCYIYFDNQYKLKYTKKKHIPIKTTFQNSRDDFF